MIDCCVLCLSNRIQLVVDMNLLWIECNGCKDTYSINSIQWMKGVKYLVDIDTIISKYTSLLVL